MTKPMSSSVPAQHRAAVPEPRAESPDTQQSTAAHHAHEGLTAVRRATAVLYDTVHAMDDAAVHGSSRLPDWTRGHVLSHLARNADGLVNLLSWAKTGVEHPMYPSADDRDADISEGAQRLLRVQQEDLFAACERFFIAAENMPDTGWESELNHQLFTGVSASQIPWMRLVEVLVHLVDLDLGFDFTQAVSVAGEALTPMLEYIVWTYRRRTDVPSLRLEVELPADTWRTWTMGTDEPHVLRGRADVVLSWLTGRHDGSELQGEVPELPTWL